MTAMLNQAAHSGLLPFCRRFGGFVTGINEEGGPSPSEPPRPPVLTYCITWRCVRNTGIDSVILHLFHLFHSKQGFKHLRK